MEQFWTEEQVHIEISICKQQGVAWIVWKRIFNDLTSKAYYKNWKPPNKNAVKFEYINFEIPSLNESLFCANTYYLLFLIENQYGLYFVVTALHTDRSKASS